MNQLSAALIYTAQSKRDFHCRDAVCQYVLERGGVPINPFRVFDYFLGDRVPRDTIRKANHTLLSRCDELWVFGRIISDGVLVEISQAASRHIPVRYFTIGSEVGDISSLDPLELEFEIEVVQKSQLVRQDLVASLRDGRSHDVVRALGRSSELTWH